MPTPGLSDDKMREAYQVVLQCGTVKHGARILGLPPMTLMHRYTEALRRLDLPEIRTNATPNEGMAENDHEHCEPIEDAVIAVFGDTHWSRVDQARSVAHEALLRALPKIKPDVLLTTGDVLDFSEISRHDPIGWGERVSAQHEIKAARLHLDDIRDAAPKAKCFWAIGNHDERHDGYLARHAAAFENEPGFKLADKFPDWKQSYRFDFGAFHCLHRWHSGEHAAYNNTLKGAVSMVTGDTHKLRITAREVLRGRQFGIEAGMLADPSWPCFRYLRGRPIAWTQGWVVLTVRRGRLLQPETCEVLDGEAWFRGQMLAGGA
jgi:predicted phosphodiesterase